MWLIISDSPGLWLTLTSSTRELTAHETRPTNTYSVSSGKAESTKPKFENGGSRESISWDVVEHSRA